MIHGYDTYFFMEIDTFCNLYQLLSISYNTYMIHDMIHNITIQ